MRAFALGALLALASWALLPATADDRPPPVSTPDPAQVDGPEAASVGYLPPSPAVQRLRDDVVGILEAPGWRRARWGVLAVSLDRGDTLVALEPRESMIPASNLKLLTTATALHHLGPDYRWMTLVLAQGTLRDGILQGDLVLYGTGDPGLSGRFHESDTAVLDTLARRLVDGGLRAVAGRVLGDGTFFDGTERNAAWDADDLDNDYAAASGALSWAENVVSIRVEATRPGVPPMIHGLPQLAGIEVSNLARTSAGAPARRLSIARDHPLEPIRITGELAPGSPDVWRRMTVQEPARYAAHAFHAALERAGIAVTGPPGTVLDPAASPLGTPRLFTGTGGLHVLARHVSPPLREYLTVINHESNNLFADVVLKTLGRTVEGEGSYRAGGRVVERFLASEVGVAPGSVHVLDGSGLADANRASPEAIVRLLEHMAKGELADEFVRTLPEAGTRDLRRMERTAAAGNLRAKTGTIRGVSALSGFVSTAGGERIAFSIIGNGLPSTWGAKRLEDRIGAHLAGLDRRLPEPAPPGPPAAAAAADGGEAPVPWPSRPPPSPQAGRELSPPPR